MRTALRLGFTAVDSAGVLAAPSDLAAPEYGALEPLSGVTPRIPWLAPIGWTGFEALLTIQITTEIVNTTTMISIALSGRRMGCIVSNFGIGQEPD